VIFVPASGLIKQRKLISLVVIPRDEGSRSFVVQIPRNLGMTKDWLCLRSGASISVAVLVTFVALKNSTSLSHRLWRVIFEPASSQIKQRKLISLVVIPRDKGSRSFIVQIPRNLGMIKDGLRHRSGASISAAVLVTLVALKNSTSLSHRLWRVIFEPASGQI
jgi:hypothetical protein